MGDRERPFPPRVPRCVYCEYSLYWDYQQDLWQSPAYGAHCPGGVVPPRPGRHAAVLTSAVLSAWMADWD